MEENKFEKQVRQKMDELQIQPSDTVWEKIEVRIQKKKSRRWGLLILFLFIGCMLTGGYWLWNTRQQKFSKTDNSVKANYEKNISQTSAKENKALQPENNFLFDSVVKKNNEGKNADERKNVAQHYKFLIDSKPNPAVHSAKENSVKFSEKKEIISKIAVETETETAAAESSQKQTENKITNKEPGDPIHEKINVDSLSKPVAANAVTKDNDTSKQKQPGTGIVKQSLKNKWKFGIVFSGGLSGIGNDFSALNNPLVFSSPGSLNSGTPPGSSSYVTKSGFGFITGVFAEKNISKKVKFTFGLNFKSFNTSVKLNDTGGTYNVISTANKYSNHFNFIEFPVSLKIRVGKGKNIPLFWQTGLVISELINSNALQFNSSTGYYYKDNSIFNKTQIGFNTSLVILLFSKQKNPISIGPYFYYDASEIANENLYNKKHFVFTGLKTEIFFGK